MLTTALEEATRLGATSAELREVRTRSQFVSLRDANLESAVDDTEAGFGLRVFVDGRMGFAAGLELADLPRMAIDAARASVPRFERVAEDSHGSISWTAPHRINPVEVPLEEKVALLSDWSGRLLRSDAVDHVTAQVLAVSEEKTYVDTSGTSAVQHLVRIHPQVSILSLSAGHLEEMRTLGPPVGKGWEYCEGEGWDWNAEIDAMPDLLREKCTAPAIDDDAYDLVIDPTNLWLTIHESVGHATELDRALGYEAAYAGTSFATPDLLTSLEYGSPLMHVTADRTTEFGLATVAIDDEGVEAQEFDLVRDGILVGYQLDRSVAGAIGKLRSNGCAYADSAMHVPIQRMANVSLRPAAGDGPSTEDLISGVDDGLYVMGDRSWSIDMQRYNFQFTGQRFYRVRAGQLVGQVRDVAYQATTTDFWRSLDGIGGQDTYLLAGAFNCGKGQPGQVAPVSHGCPSARFRQVRVLRTRT